MSSLQLTAELTDASVPAVLTIASGTNTGLSPTLAVRDPGTSGAYLDFNDNTFKTSAWTTRQQSMTEVSASNSPGRYEVTLNINAWSSLTSGVNHVALEYEVTVDSVLTQATDTMLLVNHAYDVALAGDAMDLVTGAVDATSVANGAIDAATFAAGAIDATAIANGAIDAATFAAGAIDAAALATDAVNEIVDAVLTEAVLDHAGTSGSLAEYIRISKSLLLGNYVFDNQTYNSATKFLLTGRIRCFDTSGAVASATEGGSSEGEFATFTIAGTEHATVAGQPRLVKVSG